MKTLANISFTSAVVLLAHIITHALSSLVNGNVCEGSSCSGSLVDVTFASIVLLIVFFEIEGLAGALLAASLIAAWGNQPSPSSAALSITMAAAATFLITEVLRRRGVEVASGRGVEKTLLVALASSSISSLFAAQGQSDIFSAYFWAVAADTLGVMTLILASTLALRLLRI